LPQKNVLKLIKRLLIACLLAFLFIYLNGINDKYVNQTVVAGALIGLGIISCGAILAVAYDESKDQGASQL